MALVIEQRHLEKFNRPAPGLRVKLAAVGLVIHSTGNPGSTAEGHDTWLNSGDVGVSFHLCVDWRQALEFLPWRPGEAERAGHCMPSGNQRFIGLEICETARPDMFEQAWHNAVDVAAQVLHAYGQGGDWLLTHAMVTRFWGETDHTDPVPYFAKFGKTWGDFVADVDRARLLLAQPSKPPEAQPAPAAPPDPNAWKGEALAAALKEGLFTDPHQVGEPVEMEELAAVALRLHKGTKALEARVDALDQKRTTKTKGAGT